MLKVWLITCCSLSGYFVTYRKNVVLMKEPVFFYTINYNFNAMKKRHRTLLLLTGMLFLGQMIHAKDLFSNLDKTTEKKYWEFIGERLFDPEQRIFAKFPYPEIQIYLSDATTMDSIIVKDLIKEIQPYITSKEILLIPMVQNHRNPDIWLFFPKRDSLNRSTHKFRFYSNGELKKFEDESGNMIKYDGFKGQYQSEIYLQDILFDFKDSVSDSLRKQYIQYAVLRSFCAFNGNRTDIKTHVDHAIFNSFEFNPKGTELKKVDKFLLNKLYSKNIRRLYRKYFISNFSITAYYEPYIREFAKGLSYKILVYILGILLLISLYRPVITRQYKRPFYGYVIIATTIVLIFIVTKILIELPFLIMFDSNEYIAAKQLTKDALIYLYGTLFAAALIISVILFVVENYALQKFKSLNAKSSVLKVFALPLILIILYVLLLLTIGHHIHVIKPLTQILIWGFVFSVARGIWMFLNNISDLKLKEKEVEISRLKEQKSQAELQALHSRINPHFLYNSLNTIAGLAHSDADKTEQMALSLSDLFRYTINRRGEQLCSLTEEMEMVQTYLDIEKIRFGQRMTFIIHVEQEVNEILIPKYIIQPLVENAVKHGISKLNGEGIIEISVRRDLNELIIEIADNGPAFPDGLVSGYGLQSVFDILELSYESKASIHWENNPQKFIRISIPLN